MYFKRTKWRQNDDYSYNILGGYTARFCKDKIPKTCEKLLEYIYKGDRHRFEDEYCNHSGELQISCLKTCRRCLSKEYRPSYPTSMSTMSTIKDFTDDIDAKQQKPILTQFSNSNINSGNIILI